MNLGRLSAIKMPRELFKGTYCKRYACYIPKAARDTNNTAPYYNSSFGKIKSKLDSPKLKQHQALLKNYKEILKVTRSSSAGRFEAAAGDLKGDSPTPNTHKSGVANNRNILETLVGINMKNEISGVAPSSSFSDRMKIFDKIFKKNGEEEGQDAKNNDPEKRDAKDDTKKDAKDQKDPKDPKDPGDKDSDDDDLNTGIREWFSESSSSDDDDGGQEDCMPAF